MEFLEQHHLLEPGRQSTDWPGKPTMSQYMCHVVQRAESCVQPVDIRHCSLHAALAMQVAAAVCFNLLVNHIAIHQMQPTGKHACVFEF